MGLRNFEDYFAEYEQFYGAIFDLAKMEKRYLTEEPSFEESKKYHQLLEGILSQCPKGTDIEDLIGLVVVGELMKRGKKKWSFHMWYKALSQKYLNSKII